MIDKKLILENAIRFGFVNELKKSKKNQSMIDYAVKLGFAIDQGDEAVFPWNKTGNPTYETWLLNQLKDPQHMQKGLVNFEEDGDKLEEFISEFDRLKKQRQITGIDINQLDFSGVKKIVADNEQKVSRKAMERGDVDTKTKSGYELRIFKDVSDAEEVANIGQETKWCTKGTKTAESHLAKGAIYIVFKNSEPYAQFHIETQQYMDVRDSPITQEMWQELKENIPFIVQLINRMGIVKAMSADEIYSWIESKGPHVEGDLNLYGTKISKLPDSLKSVNGNLDLKWAPISKLPDSLTYVNGIVDLTGSEISKISDDFEISESLYIINCPNIESLPEKLKVGSNLFLSNTKIKELPDDLEVGLDLIITNSHHISWFPNTIKVGRNLKFNKSGIRYLDSNLEVNGFLDLSETPIEELPKGLVVHGNLNLNLSKITELPPDLVVNGDLKIEKTQIETIPSTVKVKGKIHKYF